MPTNRPFFANFWAAFRAHSALAKASTTTGTGNVTTQAVSASTFTSPATQLANPASARTINTKAAVATNSSAPSAIQPANNAFSHTRHPSTSPHSQPSPVNRQAAGQTPASPGRSTWARRRGSDSSSDSGGFREVLGAEKWYIGGRTATGEERFLKLGMVHRERSWERRSADQMSL